MKIIVYSTPTCPFCKHVKEFLDSHRIDYADIDVSADKNEAEKMIKKSGQMGVPVIDIDGEIVIGFDKKKLKDLLGI
ncbi:MAG: glutaredoxin domain-containing protein [Candidatus Uhrbacteria bacterium]|nr:glutaredoxin domain-containing protein [Candidatus Uhrbacteria bacterium]